MSISPAAHDPSVRDYADTSPAELGRSKSYRIFSAHSVYLAACLCRSA